MADPLSIAACAIAVAGAGFKLADTIHSFVDKVRTAERHLRPIAQHVDLTSSILDTIRDLLGHEKIQKLCHNRLLVSIKSSMKGCRDAFRELYHYLPGCSWGRRHSRGWWAVCDVSSWRGLEHPARQSVVCHPSGRAWVGVGSPHRRSCLPNSPMPHCILLRKYCEAYQRATAGARARTLRFLLVHSVCRSAQVLLGVEARRRERRSGLRQGSLQRRFIPGTAAVDRLQSAVRTQDVRDLRVVNGRG